MVLFNHLLCTKGCNSSRPGELLAVNMLSGDLQFKQEINDIFNGGMESFTVAVTWGELK